MKDAKAPRRALRISLLSIGLGGLLAGSIALAHGPGRGRGPEGPARGGFGLRLLHLIDDLDLSDAQMLEVLRAQKRLRAAHQTLRRERHQDMKTALEGLASDTPDPAALHQMIDAHAEKIKRLAHTAADEALALHKILTPEQRRQLKERLERQHQRRARRWHRRDHRDAP